MNPKYVAVTIIVLAVLAGGYLFWTNQNTEKTLDTAEQQLEEETLTEEGAANLNQENEEEMQTQPTASDEFANNNWVLSSATINNNAIGLITPVPQALTLNFTKNSKSYSGFAGCNNFSGQYSISGVNGFSFGVTTSTKVACQDTMNLENEIFTGMAQITKFELINDMLTLSNDSGNTKLIYQKAI
ncbi:MAG TPA: META domain-containing protein [Candidatus Doudnabacteria bacterium]|nr:META domain-containing protein [Candidatus Doudnabacteria bacterium]